MRRQACLLIGLLVGQVNLANAAELNCRKFYVRDERAVGVGDCMETKLCQSEKVSLNLGDTFKAYRPLDLRDSAVPEAVDHLEIPVERYEDLPWVVRRFDHSLFETTELRSSGNRVIGKDEFSFYWKLNEEGTWLIHWLFVSEYPGRPTIIGRRDVQTVGVALSFTPKLCF